MSVVHLERQHIFQDFTSSHLPIYLHGLGTETVTGQVVNLAQNTSKPLWNNKKFIRRRGVFMYGASWAPRSHKSAQTLSRAQQSFSLSVSDGVMKCRKWSLHIISCNVALLGPQWFNNSSSASVPKLPKRCNLVLISLFRYSVKNSIVSSPFLQAWASVQGEKRLY